MKYWKYFILILFFILAFKTGSFEGKPGIPPYYKLVLNGINDRVSNEISEFPYSSYIEHRVKYFMRKWEIKGTSLAIVKDDRLVYAHGFGISTENQDPVVPGNIFRVASVSKLITAVGIMTLVDEHRLSLEDTVFGPDGIIKDSIFNHVRDKKLYKITVRNLLSHTGGWSSRYGDQAFNPLDIAKIAGDKSPATINSYYKYIASRRLTYTPGTRYSYSNMGYMFLANVIQEITGEKFENYIRRRILIPNGINDMHIGHSYKEEKFDNEVHYFEQSNSMPVLEFNGSGRYVKRSYGGDPVELLGSAGGWVCSAVELAKLVCLIDGQDEIKDILSPEAIKEMTNTNKSCTMGPLGWKTVYGNDWYRTGSMAGTFAMIKKQHDGLTWVFLSNTSSWKGSHLSSYVNKLMNKIQYKTKSSWTYKDLFKYYPINSLIPERPDSLMIHNVNLS